MQRKKRKKRDKEVQNIGNSFSSDHHHHHTIITSPISSILIIKVFHFSPQAKQSIPETTDNPIQPVMAIEHGKSTDINRHGIDIERCECAFVPTFNIQRSASTFVFHLSLSSNLHSSLFISGHSVKRSEGEQ